MSSSSAAAAGNLMFADAKGKAAKVAPASKPKGSAVVYLGRIPHGFFEDQIRGYFGQFGDVLRVRLSRSKKTGRSRGYAFVEFGGA